MSKSYCNVNKIDHRKTNTEEENQRDKINIKKFVYSKYRLSEENNPNQLFEISAIKALRTTQLLLEMQEYPNKDISEFESLIPFLKESCGDGWKMAQNNLITKESLNKFALEVWENSGFGLFLENAIDDLMLKAAPICIEDTLTNTLKILIHYQKPLNLRRNGNRKHKEEIEFAIKLLKNYLNELNNNFNLDNIYNELETMKERIEKEINIQLQKAKKISEKSLRDFFLDELLIKFRDNDNKFSSFFQEIDLLIKRGVVDFSLNRLRRSAIPRIQAFLNFVDNYFNDYIPESLLTIIKYKVVLKGVNVVYFENQEEAEDFRDSVTTDACTIFNKHLNEFVLEGNRIIDLNQEEIQKSLIDKTRKSLTEVLDYLNDKFDVGLKLPIFIEENIVYNNSSTIITISERKKILLQRGFDWIRSRISDKKISPNIFSISLENMIDEMNIEFDNQFIEIQQLMFNFVTNELTQLIDEFSANIQKKMKSFQEALEQSLVDKLQEKKNEEDLMIVLDNFLNGFNEYQG
ncbi:hypothetical protein NIES4072_65250 [Nostoc commune NIES-4072]|uniref:Uncharacterized protein n=1 Tax=Nostoc commune NIES-4072 TaxID=2005467 RepID=A0A2R5G2X5_NOSCO|nr:hypothetical protein [Nostoc commune]BBD70159.1 hypothetical protein NIES4070_65700 [Nostoc commune HK-02]GBG22813.1 hypothetical protein NIES4072_65250 [Nostoc commune NIES-4072]